MSGLAVAPDIAEYLTLFWYERTILHIAYGPLVEWSTRESIRIQAEVPESSDNATSSLSPLPMANAMTMTKCNFWQLPMQPRNHLPVLGKGVEKAVRRVKWEEWGNFWAAKVRKNGREEARGVGSCDCVARRILCTLL